MHHVTLITYSFHKTDPFSLQDITEVDLHVVTRAINFLRTSLCIQMKDLDPSIFLERHIVHLSTLLSSSSNPPLSGSTKSHWTPSNLTYLRALSFPRVRTLAAHVLAFSSDINLSNGRAPEQVSCAAIIVAMEAVARKPVPVETEVMEELASTLGVKHFTVAERYREFSKALADWAPKLPWLDLDLDGSASGGKKGKAMSEKMRKKELVAHTEDIVLFRKGLEKKDTQKAVVGAGDLRMLSDDELERIAQETKDDEEYEEVEEDFYDDQQGEQDVPGGVNAQFQDPLVDKTAAAELLLSFSLSGPPPDVAPPPRRRARRRTGSTSTPSKIDEHGNLTATEALAQRFQASRVFAHNKRPVEYMRQRPGFVKRVRTIETALHSLQATTSSDAAGSSSAIRPSDTDRLRHVERAASSSLHDEETIHFRRLLLAGHAPVSIYTGDAQYSTDASRLEQLLWTKKAEDVLDDELFDEGELEGFVRTEEEVATLEQTPKFVEMGEPAPFDPVKEERRVRKYERDKLARKRKAKSLLVQRKTRDQTWVPELDIDSDDGAPLESISTSGNGGRRRRGPGRKGKMKGDDDDDEEDDPFAPEVKRSKIDQATKERLARLFAEDGEIEDEDGWNEQLGVEAADDVDGGSEFV